jgi:hypothetical protein
VSCSDSNVNDIEKESTNVSLTKLRIETKPISFDFFQNFFSKAELLYLFQNFETKVFYLFQNFF